METTYFRRGFGLKAEIEAQRIGRLSQRLVEQLRRANGNGSRRAR